MKPTFTYKSDRVVLIHGRAERLAPWLKKHGVTCVFSDPPYGIKYDTKHHKRGMGGRRSTNLKNGPGYKQSVNNYEYIANDDKPFDPTPWLSFKKVVLFGANNFAVRLPHSNGWIVWDKTDCGKVVNDSGDAELAWTNVTGAVRIYRQLWKGLARTTKCEPDGTEIRVYPAQKPVQLFTWLIQKFTKPDDIICDPYMGSGSTILAAVRAGRKCIGIDINRKACDLTLERLHAVPEFKQRRLL